MSPSGFAEVSRPTGEDALYLEDTTGLYPHGLVNSWLGTVDTARASSCLPQWFVYLNMDSKYSILIIS